MIEYIGYRFGNYSLVRLIGTGSFARVYLGEHRYLEIPAAIKVLHMRMEQGTHTAFQREAHTIARLQHPHIIRVLDFGIEDQTPYLVMEYIPNGTLRTRHPKGSRLPLEQIMTYVKQIASALDYAHKHHVIHCDIKPENLLLNAKGEIVLSDFGLAVMQRTLDTAPSIENMAGTPLYMAPEQIQRHPCPASDQYALAIMVYEWLCGKPPFQGPGAAILGQHLYQAPPGLRASLPWLPPAVEDTVFGALAKEPKQRFSSVRDFAAALEDACFATQILTPRSDDNTPSERPIGLSDTLHLSATSASHQAALPQQQEQSMPPLMEKPPTISIVSIHTCSGQLQRAPISPIQRQNRTRLLRRVNSLWIEGVLEHSLHGAAIMALGLETRIDAVVNPWHLVMQQMQTTPRSLPTGTRITQVYDAAEGELLILGAPGAGKTTLLLELARDLLKRARQDEEHPIPVIFNLSSWAIKQQPIADWLIEEMNTKYQIPRKLALSLCEAEQILPLLDGLDEVEPTKRTRCIEAINVYRQDHGLYPLVVCSRATDYLAQTERLQLRNAVMIQPLTYEQVTDYLAKGGEALWALRVALHNDTSLRELTNSPLMLSILTLAYHNQSVEDLLRDTSPTTRLNLIFSHYVSRMFSRQHPWNHFSPRQAMRWLSILAQQLRTHHQTVFYLEHLHPDWLPSALYSPFRWLALRLPALLLGLLASLLISLFLLHGSPDLPSLLHWSFLGALFGFLFSPSQSATVSPASTHPRSMKGNLKGPTSQTQPPLAPTHPQYSTSCQNVTGTPAPGPRLRLRPIVGGLGIGLFYAVCSSLAQGASPWLPGCWLVGACMTLVWTLLLTYFPTTYRSASSLSSRKVVPHRMPLAFLLAPRIWQFSLILGLGLGLANALCFWFSSGLFSGLTSGFGLSLVSVPNQPLASGLLLGLCSCLGYALCCALLSSLLVGALSVPLAGMYLTEQVRWTWSSLRQSLFSNSHLRTTAWLTALLTALSGLLAGLQVALLNDFWTACSNALSAGLCFGLSLGLSYWLVLGLFQGVAQERLLDQDRLIINEGIRRSARNSLCLGLLGGGLIGLIGLLSNLLSIALDAWLSGQPLAWGDLFLSLQALLPAGLLLTLLAVCFLALLSGGLTLWRHYLLRWLLARARLFPWLAPAFLAEMTDRLLLLRVGGGYSFIHRLLLDYFADLDNKTERPCSKVQDFGDK